MRRPGYRGALFGWLVLAMMLHLPALALVPWLTRRPPSAASWAQIVELQVEQPPVASEPGRARRTGARSRWQTQSRASQRPRVPPPAETVTVPRLAPGWYLPRLTPGTGASAAEAPRSLVRRQGRRSGGVGGYGLRRDKRGNYVYRDGQRFTAVIKPDGSLRFRDGPAVNARGLGATFDVTDMVMRARGEDPYRYEKARFARATWALRVKLRRAYRKQLRRRGLQLLARRLARLKRKRISSERLRAILFQLWDECDETWNNDKLGPRVRAMIIRFIRRNLPRGSKKAYGAAELARLNRKRRSKGRFAPY